MFGGLGMGEMILILLVILLFFGAKRIPEIAGSFGKGIKEFKRNVEGVQNSINEAGREPRVDVEPRPADRLAPPEPRRDDDENRPEPKRLLG